MPNWCDTTYKVVGPEEELQELYNILEPMNGGVPVGESDFGSNWLGDAILRMGLSLDDYPDHRGEVTWVDYTPGGECVQICQNTAWCEQAGFRHAIEARFPNCKVYYQDEEPGCENYATNDTTGNWFYDKYVLNSHMDGDWDDQYFETLDEAKDYLALNYDLNFIKSDTIEFINDALGNYLIDRFGDGHEGQYFKLYAFEIVKD